MIVYLSSCILRQFWPFLHILVAITSTVNACSTLFKIESISPSYHENNYVHTSIFSRSRAFGRQARLRLPHQATAPDSDS